MSLELVLKFLMMLRLLAFMVIIYLAFGLLVERYITKPESQIRAFARTICSPITRPVARYLAPGAGQRRLLLLGMGVVVAFWVVVVVLGKALQPG